MRWPVKHATLGLGSPPDPGGGGGTGGGGDDPPPPSGATRGFTRYGTVPHQLFAPVSYINQPLPDNVTIDPNTAAVVAELVRESQNGAKPYVGTTSWSMPTFTVNSTFPRVPIKMTTQPVPGFKQAMAQIMLDPGIPLPPEYVHQGDSDDECAIYCPPERNSSGVLVPGTDTIWEFWRLRAIDPAANGGLAWTATSMWQIVGVSTHIGRSRNKNLGTYPNAPTDPVKRLQYEDKNMSVSAARIPFSGTILTLEDVVRGRCDHALALSVIYPFKESVSAVKWPASSTDGFSTTSPIREGDRYRFPPGYTIPTTLHPVAQIIAQAVRDYGFVVVDKSGSLEIDAEPEVHQYFNGTAPSSILNGFPWADLQVLMPGTDAVPNPTS